MDSGKLDKSRVALDAWLKKIPGAGTGKVVPLDDEAVRRVFPGERFYAVRFMRYPRAQRVPPPLRLENVFRVRPDGSVRLLEDPEQLKKFLQAELPPVHDVIGARDAAIASLRLAEEYYQDGSYTFDVPEDSVSVLREGDQLVATAKSMVTRGGRGQVTIKLTFEPSGKVETIGLNGRVRTDSPLR